MRGLLALKCLVTVCLVLSGCALTGRVSTELKDAYPLREAPTEYQSPREALVLLIQEIQKRDLVSKLKRNRLTEAERDILSLASLLYKEQFKLEIELAKNKQIDILPGRSYSFDVESFCVNAGEERPLQGDGFRVGPLKGRAAGWLPRMLETYSSKGISQERAQVLIWALLSDARFDELTDEQRSDLLKIDPNAHVNFGNRRLEDEARNVLEDLIPKEVTDLRDRFESFRSLLRETEKSYEEISSILAPHSDRTKSVDLGWVKAEEGYFIRASSIGGYSSARIEIYMPLGPDPLFRPSKFIALPTHGQRLAISANVISSLQKDYREITDALINWKAGRKLSDEEQDLIRKHPIDAYRMFSNAQEATKSMRTAFPNDENPHNNAADAYRHFVWSALNTRDLGEERAREFLDAHEASQRQPKAETEMDLWNNEKGIQAAKRLGSNATQEDIERVAWEALLANQLKVLR